MRKCHASKAFTIIELMVSIFITITIIASFYKLYEGSTRTERSSSIRVAVNLMGEQILDTLSESVRLIGLNSVKTDFTSDVSETSGLIRVAGEWKFVYLSPFGSPITKVSAVSGTYPNCTFTLFNSAAFYSGVDKLYFHNQDGFFKTSAISGLSYSDSGVSVTVSGFTSGSYSDEDCKNIFPVGSLVTGEDFVYTLQYTQTAGSSANSLKLSYEKESNSAVTGTLVDFSYDPSTANNFYSMPKFVMEYLIESCDSEGVCSRNWNTPKGGTFFASATIRQIIAVRFGFVLLSQKERVYEGTDTPGDLPKYCVFSDLSATSDYYCYQLPSLNYTASVFRRVVYLSNYRMLKDQIGE